MVVVHCLRSSSALRRLAALVLVAAGLGPLQAHAWQTSLDGDLIYDSQDSDRFVDVAILPGGDVVAVGTVSNFDPNYPSYLSYFDNDWLLARFDGASGAVEWSAHVTGGTTNVGKLDAATHVAVDSSGNLVVGGLILTSDDTGYVTAVAKFSSTDSSQIWGTYLGLVASYAGVTDLAVGSDDTIVVSRYQHDGTDTNFRVLKLTGTDPPGLAWSYSAPMPGTGTATEVEIDSSGDVFIAGALNGSGTVIKVDGATGAQEWSAALTSPAHLVLTADGDPLVITQTSPRVLVRLDSSDGSEVWTRPLVDYDAYALVASAAGSVFLTGSSYAAETLGSPLLISAIAASDGSPLWAHTYGTGAGTAIALSPSGDPIVAGSGMYEMSDRYAMLSVAAADGAELWRSEVSTYGTGAFHDLAVGGGRAIAAGTTYAQSPPSQIKHYATAVSADASTGAAGTCGNGVVEGGEDCDDGNTGGGDCCAGDCTFEAVSSACDDGRACSTGDVCDGVGVCAGDDSACTCGNGTVEVGLGEQCDDGNVSDGDCCSSTCQFEAIGEPCSDGDDCTQGDECNGSGVCQASENVCSCCSEHAAGGCGQASCEECVFAAEPACFVIWGTPCVNLAATTCLTSCTSCTCGNGTVTAGEACDDGNVEEGDCCDANCQIETECNEHLECYKASTAKGTPKFVKTQVHYEDQYNTQNDLELSKPSNVCTPVTVDGGDVVDATKNLECYKTKEATFPKFGAGGVPLRLSNAFGTFDVTVGKLTETCYPTSLDAIPTDLDADGNRCYKAKLASAAPVVPDLQLASQFGGKLTDVGVLASVCTPAGSDFYDLEHKERFLLCFKAKDAKTSPKQPKFVSVQTNASNTLGDLELRLIKRGLVCLPSVEVP